MKKKGFTLVELLAVIAILAILVIIALPNVMKLFNRAKEQAFTTELKEIYKVAQQQWIADSMFNTQERTYAKCSSETCDNQLDMTGRSELEYNISIDKSGNVISFQATDGSYQYSYSGTGLKIEDIGDVEQISKITDESNIISVSCSGATGGSGNSGSNVTNIATCVQEECTKTVKGTELTIAGDNFYVVSSNDTETVLLAKYDLKSDGAGSYEQDTSGTNENIAKMKFANSGYWDDCQSNTLRCTTSSSGLLSPYDNSANPIGTSGMYGRYTEPYPYVYDSNSNLYQYVESYVNKLSGRVGLSITGRLLSYEEANTLSGLERKDLNNHYYWLGNASAYDSVAYVDQYNGQLMVSAMGLQASVRPVIIVPTSCL